MGDSEFISAREAAALLGVSVTTLYVYVGRKGLRSQPVPGSRERRYWKPDILKLKRDSRSRRSTPVVGELKRDSALTLRTEEGPFYRGQSAILLAEAATLEDVAALLWDIPVEKAFLPEVPRGFDGQRQWARLLADKGNVDRALALFPRLEQADPRAFDLSPFGMARTGADVVRWMTAITLGQSQASLKPVHVQIADALGLDTAQASLARRLLVIAADHGFEPGAYAVRAVASTGVTPWRTVMAGLMVAAGRRSGFGRYEGVRQFLDELLGTPDGKAPVIRRLRDGEAVPGFGSTLYDGKDPRARVLMDDMARVYADDPRRLKVEAACAVVREALGAEPDFGFALLTLQCLLGLHAHNSIYLIGRAVGWVAHSIEQYAASAVEHREARYLGPLPQ